MYAPFFQSGYILPHGRMAVHVGIHGGAIITGHFTERKGGAEEIIGYAAGELADYVGGGRGHQKERGIVLQ
jgi:hypothetical protein